MKKNLSIYSMATFAILSFILIAGCEKEELSHPEIPQDENVQLKAAVSSGTYMIINRNSRKALDVNTSNNNVIQYSYWGGSNQKWIISDIGSGYFRISPVSNSGKALDVAGQSTANGANVQVYSYWGGSNQQWQLADAGNGYYKIVNRRSGKCLDVSGQSVNNGANIVQWSYWGGANQQFAVLPLEGKANGQLSWRLTSSNVPSDIKSRVTNAMNAAVSRYNEWGNWGPRTLTVEYNPGVPTADASINGHIRFGKTNYMTERTALHEIGHTYGVGTSSKWSSPLIQNSKYVGSNALTLIKLFDGDDATISTDRIHFWPYGLNYDYEMSEINADRHVQIVWAMVQDGLY